MSKISTKEEIEEKDFQKELANLKMAKLRDELHACGKSLRMLSVTVDLTCSLSEYFCSKSLNITKEKLQSCRKITEEMGKTYPKQI